MSRTKPPSLVGNPPEILPSDAPAPVASKQRRLFEAALFFLALAGTVALIVWLTNAWRATQLQEAYLPQLEAQVQQDPYNVPLLAVTGGRLIEAGDVTAAADTLRQAVGTGEPSEVIWQVLAAATAAGGDTTRALADLRIGIHALPEAPMLQAALARAAALGPTAAPDNVARAISPQGPEPLLKAYGSGSILNGVADWWGRRYPEQSGFATRQRWFQDTPYDPEAMRFWGLALLRNQRNSDAVEILQQAAALAPASPETHLALADALEQAGFSSQSTLQYMACLRLRPNWLPALLGLGRTALAQNLSGYAVAAFTRATQIAPRSADAWIGLGRYYLKTGSTYDHAVADFQKAAQLEPARTDFSDDYAVALYYNSQWNTAESILRRRLNVAPNDSYGHYLLGQVLLDNRPTPDRQTEAEAETRTALKLAPHNPPTEIQLAGILLDNNQPAAARDLLLDAVAQNRYNHNALLLLARAYQQTGQPAMSQQVTTQAQALFADQEHARILEAQEQTHGLDLRVHQELAALDARIGLQAQANNEMSIVRMIQADPKRAARSLKAFHAQVQSLLPNE